MDSSRQSHSQCLRVWENGLPTVLEMAIETANSKELINCRHNNEIPRVSSHKAALITLGEWVANLIWMCQITLTIGKKYPFEAEEIFKDQEMKLRTWTVTIFLRLGLLQVSKVTTALKRIHTSLHPSPTALYFPDGFFFYLDNLDILYIKNDFINLNAVVVYYLHWPDVMQTAQTNKHRDKQIIF